MKTGMYYDRKDAWVTGEEIFDRECLGKAEAVLSLGNGYMGLRSATEEGYLGEKRGLFVAGTFNCSDASEVTELPNAADVTGMEFYLNGKRFSLDTGKYGEYRRSLNLYTGELSREVGWEGMEGEACKFRFSRFVSRKRLPLIGQKVTLRALTADIRVRMRSGINGQMTNSGAQHFRELEKRFYENCYLQYTAETTESGISFVTASCHRFFLNGAEAEPLPVLVMRRRQVLCEYEIFVPKGSILQIEKLSAVHHSRDLTLAGKTVRELQTHSLGFLKEARKLGYDSLFRESSSVWAEEWEEEGILLESRDAFDQLAIRFAQYHLAIMTPAHDHRMSIGAKGLSGEGYKGHTFWDCDQFILPYFTFTFPRKAKSLVKYRYATLEGARRKAREGGFAGAQFPWESAWVSDGEVTPAFGDADLVTGLPQTIWTGKIEQHITADVAYGVWQYWEMTGDRAFMEECGYEIILDTACFWCNRLEEGEDGKLHINNVIGPDEYKEHVDDNAYTNYMAWWNMKKAEELLLTLPEESPGIYELLGKKLPLQGLLQSIREKEKRMYLPKPDETGLMPQDSTYLSLKEIDLSKYKAQDYVLGIYKDYNAEQLNHIQVSKQADILILFYLLEHLFDEKTKKANWDYYEPKTLHDSSLSLSTHCILAADLNEREKAYEFFRKACEIDLGPNMKSSDEGIHSASIGGIWQCVVFGFAGIRMVDGKLRIRPRLPEPVTRIICPIWYQGKRLLVTVEKDRFLIKYGGEVKEYSGESFPCFSLHSIV